MRGNVQARFWSGGGGGDVFAYRNHSGDALALLTTRQRAYGYRHTERFLAELASLGADAPLTEALARWTAALWKPGLAERAQPVPVFYVPRHAQ